MEKLFTSKSFLKIAGGRMHTLHPNPLAIISYGNHQKSLAYFSHLAPLVLFFFYQKAESKGGGGGGHGTMPSPKRRKVPISSPPDLLMLTVENHDVR